MKKVFMFALYWWCIMYPSLGFSDITCSYSENYSEINNALSTDSFMSIANNCEFSFKILDF